MGIAKDWDLMGPMGMGIKTWEWEKLLHIVNIMQHCLR